MDAIFLRTAITCCLTLLLINIASAESVYVKDSLRVGVRSEPSNSVSPIGVVVTGMQLEVLEYDGDFVKIRTDKGLEGWIKSTYVGQEKPAMLKLDEMQKELQRLKSQTGKRSELIETTEATNKELSEQVEDLKSSNNELRVALSKEKAKTQDSIAIYIWIVLSYIFFCLLGIVLGVYGYRRYTMKRLGGLRV